MEHGKPIFLHMEVLRAHRDVGRGSIKKRRAVGHVTCTEKVADWAFSWIKADQLAEFVDRIPRNVEFRMKIGGLLQPSLYDRPFPLSLPDGICPITTCGGTEGTDSASVPHPQRKKLLNHHKKKKV